MKTKGPPTSSTILPEEPGDRATLPSTSGFFSAAKTRRHKIERRDHHVLRCAAQCAAQERRVKITAISASPPETSFTEGVVHETSNAKSIHHPAVHNLLVNTALPRSRELPLSKRTRRSHPVRKSPQSSNTRESQVYSGPSSAAKRFQNAADAPKTVLIPLDVTVKQSPPTKERHKDIHSSCTDRSTGQPPSGCFLSRRVTQTRLWRKHAEFETTRPHCCP